MNVLSSINSAKLQFVTESQLQSVYELIIFQANMQ